MEQKQHLLVTRSAQCNHCLVRSMPRKGQLFAVLGSNHATFSIRRAINIPALGMTPHLYSIPIPMDSEYVEVTRTCMMHTCGVTIHDLKPDGSGKITFERVEKVVLARNDVVALINRWNGRSGGSGYEVL